MEFFNVTAMGVQLFTEIKRLAIYLISLHTLVATLVLKGWLRLLSIYGVFTTVEGHGLLTIFE